MNKLLAGIVRLLDLFAVPAWVLFVVVLFAQVLSRYVFNSPLAWAEEVARLTLVWLTFTGAIQLIILNDHIDITVFSSKARGLLRNALSLLKLACMLATGLYLTIGAFDLIKLTSSSRSPGANLPVSLWYWPAAVCGAFIIFSLLILIISRQTSFDLKGEHVKRLERDE